MPLVALICVLLIVATTLMHYEVLSLLSRALEGPRWSASFIYLEMERYWKRGRR